MSEAAFYALYAWCLNPLLSLADLLARLQEEIGRFEEIRVGWQMEECRINLYLFACAIACTVDDYLAWSPWDIRRLATARPHLRGVAASADWILNVPYRLKVVTRRRRLRGWRDCLQRYVDRVCDLLVAGGDARSEEWAAARAAGDALLSERLPADALTRRMRIPEGYRCQDMAHQDVLALAHRLAASRRAALGTAVVVIGARTAGAYFAPLVSAYLSRHGWPRCSWFSIRPKGALSRWERRQLRRLGRGDAHVVLVDDYPDTGLTFARMVSTLKDAGVESSRITVLMPDHPVRLDWRAASESGWAAGISMVALPHAELHKMRLLQPEAMEPLLAEYFADVGAIHLHDSAAVDAINAELQQQHHDGFEVRLKRVFEIRLRRGDGAPETRRVVAKSVGWGWLGYHAFFIGQRLSGQVPPAIGLRDGLMLSAWIDEAEAIEPRGAGRLAPGRLASYVAARTNRLRLPRDPCFDSPGYRWTGWDEIVGILRDVYGPYVGRLKSRAIRHRLRPLVSPMPAVVDGRMRPGEWIQGRAQIYKVDAEHHNFGGGELDIADPAYDLAAAFFEHEFSEEQQREALAAYVAESGDSTIEDRLLLYELLYGVVAMRAAAEAATRADRSARREVPNRRYLWARAALVERMNRFHAELGHLGSEARWTKRLFFLDLDGVFDSDTLGFPHTTPSGIAALEVLRGHDVSVVLNTGRSAEQVRRYCASYRLPGGLAEHGGVFVDAVHGREVSLIDADGTAQLERGRRLIAALPRACADPAYTHSIRVYRFAGRRTTNIGAAEISAILIDAGCDRLDVIERDADTYIVQKGTGKAAGIRAVREYLGWRDEPAAAIGDSDLDREALHSVEWGYAPANCTRALRTLARRGGCRVMREPMQRGLLAAARDLVRHGSADPRRTASDQPPTTGAANLLRQLLEAADRPRVRRWLAAFDWRGL
jgi:hydroxymethylpyrimidine pyrophosphatase-like HAD family hydrolase/orotate phosphoribosyltransferase